MRQLEKNELRVTGYHLGPSGMKALAEALSETHIGDGASAASTLIRVSDENINSHEEFGEAEWHLDLTRRSGQRTGSRAKQARQAFGAAYGILRRFEQGWHSRACVEYNNENAV